MTDPILPLLLGIVVALTALGAAAGFVARRVRPAIGLAGTALAGLGSMLSLLALAMRAEPDGVGLPLGLPGMALRLALDPLAALFLTVAFLAGTARIAFAAETAGAEAGTLALRLAGVVLTILAADGTALTLGLALAVGTGHVPKSLGIAGLGALACFAALALVGVSFDAVRAELDRSWMFWALALMGPAALAFGAARPLFVYLLLRFALDLGGPSPPVWVGMALLAAGSAGAMFGGWRAATGAETDTCLEGLTERQSGLAAIGVGLALVGKAGDLPALTTLAVAAALFAALSQSLSGALGQMVAGAVLANAGSRRLTSLGGLIHSIPWVATALAAVLFAGAVLPFGGGFVTFWLQLQALAAAPRGIWLAGVAAALALSAVLSGVALVRLFGVAFLGRPRGPRTAGAMDIPKAARPGPWALSVAILAMGVLPGPVLMLADGAIGQLAGVPMGERVGWFGPLPALPLLFLAVVIGGAVVWAVRRRGGAGHRVVPAWNEGFAPSPPWLPFGEPLTQSAGGFLPELAWTKPRWRVPRVAGLPLLLAAVAVLLAVLAAVR